MWVCRFIVQQGEPSARVLQHGHAVNGGNRRLHSVDVSGTDSGSHPVG